MPRRLGRHLFVRRAAQRADHREAVARMIKSFAETLGQSHLKRRYKRNESPGARLANESIDVWPIQGRRFAIELSALFHLGERLIELVTDIVDRARILIEEQSSGLVDDGVIDRLSAHGVARFRVMRIGCLNPMGSSHCLSKTHTLSALWGERI